MSGNTVLSGAVRHNWWFGHYNPARLAGTSTNPTQPNPDACADFRRAYAHPFQGRNDAARFFTVAADVLPSLRPVAQALSSGDVRVHMLCHGEWPSYMESSTGRTLLLPMDTSPQQSIIPLIGAVSALVPLPEGVELPSPLRGATDLAQARRHIWAEYTWRVAVAESLTLQVVLEMERAGIHAVSGAQSFSVLTPTDMALFRVLREQGLAGLARVYPKYMYAQSRQMYEQFVEQQARVRLVGGGLAAVADWEPPDCGERPELPRTVLDERIDALYPMEAGLYMQADGLTRLTYAELSTVRGYMDGTVQREVDMRDTIEAMRLLAPVLAERVLREDQLAGIRFEILDTWAYPEPLVAVASLHSQLGFPCPGTDDEAMTILVHRGVPKGFVVINLIKILARVSIPAVLHSNAGLAGLSEDTLVHYLERMTARNDLWGYSANFEFVHESAQRGVRFVMSEHHQRMRTLLDDCGFAVFCEHWRDFTNPAVMPMLQTQWAQLARSIRGGALQ